MDDGKVGFLEKKLPGKKKSHFFWFSLMGSTLFSYKEKGSSVPKDTYQLRGSDLTYSEKDFTITISQGGKEVIKLIATSKSDGEGWFNALQTSKDKEATAAPDKEEIKRSKGSLVGRAGKNAVSKVITTGFVKSAVRSVVNEETKLLLVALKKIITKVESSKKADEIENNIMKILTKAFFLDKEGIINADDFEAVDEPLRETFEILVFMRDYRERMRPSTVDEKFAIVQANLKKVEDTITSLLDRHLKAKNTAKIHVIFGLLSSIDFLNQAWSDESIDDERNLLADAMNRYTQFH